MNYLRNNNNEFENIKTKAKHFMSTNLNKFELLKSIRKSKVPRNSDELLDDERIIVHKEKLMVEIFYTSLDIIIKELQTRFNSN